MSGALQVGLREIPGWVGGSCEAGEAHAPRAHQRMRPCSQSGTRPERQLRTAASHQHIQNAHLRVYQRAAVRWAPGVGSWQMALPLRALPHNESVATTAVTSSGNGAAAANRGTGTGRKDNSRDSASPGLGMQYINASVLAAAESPESAAIANTAPGLRPGVVHHVPAQEDDASLGHLLLLLRSISNSSGLSRSASAPDETQLSAILRSLPGGAAGEGGVPEAEQEAAQYRVEAGERGAPLAPVSRLPRLLRMRASELSPESLEVLAGPSGEGGVPQAVLDAEWPLEVVQLPLLSKMARDARVPEAKEGAVGGGATDGGIAGESEGAGPEGEGAEEGEARGSRSSWMELLLAEAKSGAGVTLGSAPATAEEMEWVLETTGCSVVICLQDEQSMGLLGSSFQEVGRAAAARHVGMFHIPMQEHNEESQASALPEAVRVLASLLSTGHRVHISCLRGVTCSPLVVLGYLTFFKGEEFSKSVAWLKGCCPGASPSYAAWEQAKERLTASLCMQKMADQAFAELRTRSNSGARGSTVGDWMVAQRKLLAKAMQQRVADDVAMTQLLAEAKVLQVEESAAAGTEAEQATKERVRQLASEVDRLERRQVEAAGEAARAARRMEAFRQKLVKLQESEAGAKEEAAAAGQRVGELRRQLEEVEERERMIVLARDESTGGGSSSALSAAEAAYHRELEEAQEMELQRLREENRALARAVEGARADLEGAERRAQDLHERLCKVQTLGVASIATGAPSARAAPAAPATDAASAVLSGAQALTGAGTGVPASAGELPVLEATEAASDVAGSRRDPTAEHSPGSVTFVVPHEGVASGAEEGMEGRGEDAGGEEGDVGGEGQGEGLFAGDEEVAEVIERLTRIVHNEMEVHSVAQYTVKKLAAAAQQLEELQRREEELVHVWHTTQERVEQLAQQLSSAEATAQRHLEELSSVVHHRNTPQNEISHAPAPPGIERAQFRQYQQQEESASSLAAQWHLAKQNQQPHQTQGQGQGHGQMQGQGVKQSSESWQPAMSEVEQALGQRIGAAAAEALERTRHCLLRMQAVALKVLAAALSLMSGVRYAQMTANWEKLTAAVAASASAGPSIAPPLVNALGQMPGMLRTAAQVSWKILHPALSAFALGARFLGLLLSLIALKGPGTGHAQS